MTQYLPRSALRSVALGALLLGAAGCAQKSPVDAPPESVTFFNPFSADLDDAAKGVINQISTDALAHPDRRVIVEGFADSIGAPSSNQTLSKLRAQVVADALVSHGVPPSHIILRPRGATQSDPGIESRRVDVSFGR